MAQTASNRPVPHITSAPANTEKPAYEVMIQKAREAFLQVCDEVTWLREVTFAMQIISGNKLLQDVARNPAAAMSITNAIANVAMTGTTLNPILKKAYLVPRQVNGVMTCCLDFSYQGLVGIAVDSGSVKYINAVPVYSFDKFTYEILDGDIKITHAPSLDPPEEFLTSPDKFWEYVVCCYTVATLHDGTKMKFPPLPKWKIKKAMDTSKTTSANTPWRTHPDEMSLKTAIKHDYKLMPQTDRMSRAVAVLNEHEGIETEADRRLQARAVADAMFSRAEDATFTEVPSGAPAAQQKPAGGAASTTQRPNPTTETKVDPLITPDQCAEIDRRITECGADYGQFLSFLGVNTVADITVSMYGTAIAALESKKRTKESEGARQRNAESQGQQDGLFQPTAASANEILGALNAKNLMPQMDEASGIIFVKVSYNDGANKEFVKGLGFKWDGTNKMWYWKAA